MKLGIIGAMDMEVEILVAALENKEEYCVAGSRFYASVPTGSVRSLVYGSKSCVLSICASRDLNPVCDRTAPGFLPVCTSVVLGVAPNGT